MMCLKPLKLMCYIMKKRYNRYDLKFNNKLEVFYVGIGKLVEKKELLTNKEIL